MFRTLAKLIKRVSLLAIVGFLLASFLARGLPPSGRRDAGARSINPAGDVVTPAASSAKSSPSGPTRSEDVPDVRLVSKRSAERSELLEAVARLDQAMAESWNRAGVPVADQADWTTVCRRLSLALVGSGVAMQEWRALAGQPETQRSSIHLERLLQDPRHHDYWGERFTRMFVGAEDGPFIAFRRRRFRLWLSEAIAENRPWDQLLRQLVTARGLATDRPEVNFLTVTLSTQEEDQPDPIRLAARFSRSMLGLRIDCLQCHDDFLGNVSLGDTAGSRPGTQQDFHALAAFFAPARFNGLQGIRDSGHAYRYQFLDADEETEVEAGVPWGSEWLPTEGTDRERLAAWLTHPENRQVALHVASRVWALLFGRPAGPTVDDLPLDQTPPPALDALADELIRSGYDIRHLVRVIAHSRAFRLDSAADFEVTPEHEALGCVFPLSRLRPEQVAASVIQASRVKAIDRDSSLIVQLQKFGGVNDFVDRFGDIGEDEFDQEATTISQRLLMLNGKLVREHAKSDPLLSATAHIHRFARSDAEAIDSVYLCVLNRYPDPAERDAFLSRLATGPRTEPRDPETDSDPAAATAQKTGPNRQQLIEDLFWVLVNSSEFVWNH